jgi:glycosyltransferase involved in cell wall biosynthesis
LRNDLALEGREVVYSARNFTPIYNQLLVVRAFHLVHRHRPSAYLLMKNYGGDADYVAAVRALIAELGLQEQVRILEQVDYEQMPAIYRTADVTVSVPSSDATPMSVLEAMASGSIAIVGALPSLLEWIEPGRTGLVVDSLTPENLAAMIDRGLQARREGSNIPEAARLAVESRASQHAHMAAANRHYSALINSPRRTPLLR